MFTEGNSMVVALKQHKTSSRQLSWWRVGSLACAFLVMLGGIYAGILTELVRDWWDDANYSHGFLVPLFSGYLVWQRQDELQRLRAKGSWLGLIILLGGIGALILGDIGAEHFLTKSSFIIVIAGLILFHLGADIFRVLSFPLAYLFFMIPLPALVFNAVAFPLQGLAAQNATWVLDLLGVPVLRDGNVIHLSHITLGVTEACSGIRSLISLIALAVAWAYWTLPGVWPRLVLVSAAVPITIVANAIRVVLTGLIGQRFGVEHAQGFFHVFEGWVIFLVAFVGLLGVSWFVRRASCVMRQWR
jgi:exosortase